MEGRIFQVTRKQSCLRILESIYRSRVAGGFPDSVQAVNTTQMSYREAVPEEMVEVKKEAEMAMGVDTTY